MITCSHKSTLTTFTQFIIVAAVAIALFAVLLPVFATAHNRAVHDVQSRIAVLGRSLSEYTDDNDGALPDGTFAFHIGTKVSLTGMGWAGQLYPYVMSPSDFDDAMGESTKDPSHGTCVAYAYNENAARHASLSSWTDRSKTVILYQVTGARAKIDEPGEGDCDGPGACSPAGNGTIIMLMDGLFPRKVQPATGDLGNRMADSLCQPWPAPEIDNGSFFLFGDGHVRFYEPQDVSSGDNAAGSDNPQIGEESGRAAGTLNSGFKGTFSTQ